jgi:hypothetical protein
MRKLKLDQDALKVDSFPMVPGPPERKGTVYGRLQDNPYPEDPTWDTCGGGGNINTYSCIGPTYCCPPTWRPTCWQPTCAESCEGTCHWQITCVDFRCGF